jgi:SH3-like domain-containing protein
MRAAFIVLLRKLVRTSLAGLAASVILLAGLAASAGEMVSVSGKQVNLRSGPGTNTQATWMLSRGYPLKVIGRQGNWLKVEDFEKDVGWILQALTSSRAYHIVTVRIANMRARPSTQSRAVGQVAYGEVVRTLEKRSDWVQVQRANKVKGWVARRLLWGW